MGRALRNTLEEATMLERLVTNVAYDADATAALARYGADLLGRAIGHEMFYETTRGLPATMFYSNLIHELDHTATRKIMAFTAAREVQAAGGAR